MNMQARIAICTYTEGALARHVPIQYKCNCTCTPSPSTPVCLSPHVPIPTGPLPHEKRQRAPTHNLLQRLDDAREREEAVLLQPDLRQPQALALGERVRVGIGRQGGTQQ